MTIVFLIGSYVPHQLVSIKKLISTYNVEAHSFSISKNYTFIPTDINGLQTYLIESYSKKELLHKVLDLKPDLVVVSGWFEKKYVWVAKRLYKELIIPVISVSDTQWRGSIKQHINRLISSWHLKKTFSHIWVAGIYQYEYARKLGFTKNQIIYNSLSCDTNLFNRVALKQKKTNYPKNFLYIGRFVKVKGLDLLANAWNQIKDKKGWKLTLIGDGPLKKDFENSQSIIFKDFMPQNELITEMENSGCFILPSVFEQWSLAIHEAAAAALPIIATDVCGASPHFVINSYNGFQIKPNADSIKNAMERIISMDDNELIQLSENSRKLAATITPELGSAQLISILNSY